MINLSTRGTLSNKIKETLLGRVTLDPFNDSPDNILVTKSLSESLKNDQFAAVFCKSNIDASLLSSANPLIVYNISETEHLSEGDVVRIMPSGYIQTLYRKESPHNSIFATDRCNSFCVMCSQPPKNIDDSELIREHLKLITLIDPATTQVLGITGGEPTLLRGDFLRLISKCRETLPSTSIHVLTNGRMFSYQRFAEHLAEIKHPSLVLAIPLYSDLDYQHDHVVQAKKAFEQTVLGMLNLGRNQLRIEIRVVIHRMTYRRLPELAEFIYRNFPFAYHVALMGLEPMGFAVPNFDELWIDPVDYQDELIAATQHLASSGMAVSIYNHPLCVVPQKLWSFSRKSISDWKNEYLPCCELCSVRGQCGGFFSSSIKRQFSQNIKPILHNNAEMR